MRQITGTLFLGLLLATCSGEGAGTAVGTEGGPCYADGTCNSGLSCLSNLCVNAPCTLGTLQDCACPGGATGTQQCGAEHTWGACQCPADCGDGVCDPEESHATCPADCEVPACGDSICAADETCYDTICWAGLPPCLDPNDPGHTGWPSDLDLEPNGNLQTAVVLPCGDDAVFTNPVDYMTRCPDRQNYTNGFMNLVICPAGESDYYALYLMPEESVMFRVLYQYNSTLPRDIDARVVYYDPTAEDYVEVASGLTTNDNEEFSFATTGASGNPPGWYYLVVSGKTGQDVNYYTVSFTLNASQI